MQFRDVFQERVFNISNSLSVLRILLLPAFVYYSRAYVKSPERDDLFYPLITIILVGSLSDFLDGFLARLLNQETMLGRYLDPVADKLTGTVALITLVLYYSLPLWVFLIHVLREIGGVWMGTFLYFKRDMQGKPNIWGKLGVALTALLVVWYVLTPRLASVYAGDHWFLHPEIVAYALVVVLIVGMISYWATYWNVIFGTNGPGDKPAA
ncbi:MAG: CDP-alcohol phosphatidyltransferase family protein [Leptospirales bacterium]|jgi:CDP-diacylglycerol--glycerol-3-phosphate 3-phosphatidyltransferase